jgi:antitoxin (DNA-binding transcriptional repressor) of toxin-antitoxin stability system
LLSDVLTHEERETIQRVAAGSLAIEAGEEVVITRNGKPFALLLNTKPAEL